MIPPNIMWPAKGSGFEADPFSPAGAAQRRWWLINAARHGYSPRSRVVGRVFVAFMLAMILIGAAAQLIQLLS